MSSKKNTPMMDQYLSIKKNYPDTILFYRMGDFYEMFFDDAKKAASILEIALTSRNKNDKDPIPMCGVPFRAADSYISKLIENGCKVAICEQTEDAGQAKGLVKREVVRVVTPGMILNEQLLDRSSNNFLLALSRVADQAGIAYLDISTGTFRTTQLAVQNTRIPPQLIDEALRVDPSEIILPASFERDPAYQSIIRAFGGKQITFLDNGFFNPDDARTRLSEKFRTRSLEGFGCEHLEAGISAAGAVISYVQDTQLTDTEHIFGISAYELDHYLLIDNRSCKNLELLSNIQTGSVKGSLVSILDRTVTAMGSRLIKTWIRYPLIQPEKIEERLDSIEELTQIPHSRKAVQQHLKSVYDLERLGSRISMGQGNARDLIALKNSLYKLPDLFGELDQFSNPFLNGIIIKHSSDTLTELGELADLIQKAIREDAVHTLNEGNLINDGYDDALDELIEISRGGKSWIAKAEQSERDKTGLSSLKIKYNKVFGYFIEVSKAQAAQVPEGYIRKQTLVNAERFITEEMKTVESRILNAQEKRNALEYEIFCDLRSRVVRHSRIILEMAAFIARVDVLSGLAQAAEENHYTRPAIAPDESIHIEEGRHPVVEKLIIGERYVPNTILMDNTGQQILLITGPNMAGKSTVLRQVALTVLMTQIGSFVPAKKASCCIVDRIFTRVGALDNLSSGQSTFMVEMEETANIVNNATHNSLVILDEIGRGTSTFDGMSIAWAVAEYLHDLDDKGVKTLFATHYHELTQLEQEKTRIKNFNIAVKEFNDNIVFLRRLVEGGTNKSYGIQVARLAGVPDQVIIKAKSVLNSVENADRTKQAITPDIIEPNGHETVAENPINQMDLFSPDDESLRQELKKIDISSITPLEALNILNNLKQKAMT